MATVLRWGQGITGPTAPIELAGGSGLSLAGAEVALSVEALDGSAVILDDAACALVGTTAVRYDRQAADVADPRRLRGYFVASYSDGSTQRFPEEGYVLIIVEPALGTP
jgi:hypothetical protein